MVDRQRGSSGYDSTRVRPVTIILRPVVHYAGIQFIFGNKNTVSGSFQVLKYTVLSF